VLFHAQSLFSGSSRRSSWKNPKLSKLTWPPILERREVNRNDLDPHSQDYADWHNLMKTPRNPVVQGFATEKPVLSVDVCMMTLLDIAGRLAV